MFIHRSILLLILSIVPIAFCQETDREVPDRDRYSGRTVDSREMAYTMMKLREANAPRVGEMAPDFTLRRVDNGKKVSLKQLCADKPVVLIMSSWGCDIFRESLAGLHAIYTMHSAHAHFVMVYIREVHPYNGFGNDLGRTDDALTEEERLNTARRCREQLNLPFTVLIDSMDDKVATRWGAWPVRAFVVGKDGKIIYAGGQGPWSYRPYPGFVHGSGQARGADHHYSSGTLKIFLNRHFANQTEKPSVISRVRNWMKN